MNTAVWNLAVWTNAVEANKNAEANAAQKSRVRTHAALAPPAASAPLLLPCGGDLPPCYVKARESGGNYQAYNPTGCGGYSCGGAWQFDPRTWNNYGGYPQAQLAPPEVQDAKAREVWNNGAGCQAWSAC